MIQLKQKTEISCSYEQEVCDPIGSLQLKISISVTGILIMSCCCILHMYTHSINSVDLFTSLLLLVVLVTGTTAHPLTVYGKPYGSEHVITLFYAIPVSCEGRDTVPPTKGTVA